MNAPKETKNIWWLIAIKKVGVKLIYGSVKKIIIIKWKRQPPIAWYMLLTDKGKLLLIFFCHKVEVVIGFAVATLGVYIATRK